MIPMILVLFVLPVLAYLEGIQLMVAFHKKNNGMKNLLHLYKLYTYEQVLNNSSLRYASVEAFFLMVVGSILTCALNFATLKFYRIVPDSIYASIVVGNVVILFVICMILPFAINVYENSAEALNSWRSQLGPKSKYLNKKFRALRPFRFYAGINDANLFLYEKSVNAAYFAMILDFTINLLVSFPTIDGISF